MARGNIFRRLPKPRVQKSNFNMAFDHRTTLNMGYLIPILHEETLPGDSWTLQCEPFVRAAALLAPVMSRIDVRIDYFHVSNRILWPSWERFYKSELINKAPFIKINDSQSNLVKPGSLGDYMGLPAFETLNNYVVNEVSAFPFAAYNFIWNEFYRHQYVQNERLVELTNDDNTSNFLQYAIGLPEFRNWRHDYFTSANPFPSAGAEMDIPVSHRQANLPVRKVTDGLPSENESGLRTSAVGNLQGTTSLSSLYTDPVHQGTIEDLRKAIRIQEWLEKLLRGGSRMREMLYSFFGVDNMDMRMQVPEYIGSHTNSLRISEVLSTGQTLDNQNNVTNPVGQLAGHGVSMGATRPFKFFARENGHILGLMSIQPKPTYLNQGIAKKWTRSQIYDYYFPQFADFGEQEILNKEIFIDDTETNQTSTFGYAPRYAEYKFRNNRVSGEFATNLDFWTFARKFVTTPVLDEQFIKASVTVNPFAIKDGSHNMRAMIYHNNRVVRPMPRYSTPKTGG
jgi:hypothetical protein